MPSVPGMVAAERECPSSGSRHGTGNRLVSCLHNERRTMTLGKYLRVLLSCCCLSVCALLGCSSSGCGADKRVVLYCAQDREFAEECLEEFTKQQGLKVSPKFDTEADKSVSLYVELVADQKRPRCDVFWNNE